MNKIINNRLLAISDFVYDNDKIIDIGCDHGLLGIYLFLNRKNLKIISSDINKLPLHKAHDNLVKYHLEDKITLKLGNGLEAMEPDINTVIISGMGGITINSILKDINNYSVDKLIISPNSDFILTRKYITKLGFKLIKEKMVLDKDKYYLISYYEKGRSKTNYLLGVLDLNDDINLKYIKELISKNKEIIKKLPRKYTFKRMNLRITNLYLKRRTK